MLNKLKLLIMTKFVIDLTKSVGNDTANNSTANFYKRQLMQNIDELGLTVAGQDAPPVRSGINQAGFGNLITIGTAPNHDVEWVRRPQFACEKGYKPILDIVDDWTEINRLLVQYYKDKYEMKLKYGAKVTFHDGFVKIGTEIVTYDEMATILAKYMVR